MTIRPARPDDADALVPFLIMGESEFIEVILDTTDPALLRARLAEHILHPTPNRYSWGLALVAEADGVPIGSVFSYPADDQPALDTLLLASFRARGWKIDKCFQEGAPGTWYISSLAVHPERRGQGVGSALVRASEAQGAARGYACASLLASQGKPRAQALYERLGYTVREPVRIAEVTYSRMVKDLRVIDCR